MWDAVSQDWLIERERAAQKVTEAAAAASQPGSFLPRTGKRHRQGSKL